LVAITLLAVAGLFVAARVTGPPPGVGSPGGELAPCPRTPNCVSSLARDQAHHLPPLPYPGSAAEARRRLREALARIPRSTIVTAQDDYLHAEVRSAVFRFVDDVEFWFDDPNRVVHFRSASRVGRGDFGVNRRRMGTIRAVLQASRGE
jgi:uncharacterized protein (DUF1499 family)